MRYKIEAKNAELKHVFGYDRADSYGIDCMRMQGALVIFAANIRRILRLTSQEGTDKQPRKPSKSSKEI